MFNTITKEAHSYLLIDLVQSTPPSLRFRTDILNDHHLGVVYALPEDVTQTSFNGEEAFEIEETNK